jgi:hypothetical protein
MQSKGLLTHGGRFYFWWALLLSFASLVLYYTQAPGGVQPPNGGTWQGYTLGTIGAFLIVWLSLLGIRKRRYSSRIGTVAGWASAHVYLGLALLLVATLHCAWQFGWNVHTLAYALMCGVIGSGLYGLLVYLRLPQVQAQNRAGKDREAWLDELRSIDTQIQSVAAKADADTQTMSLSAQSLTAIGKSIWAQLWGLDRSRVNLPVRGLVANTDQAAVIDYLASHIPSSRTRREAEVLNELLDLFGRRKVLLSRMREDLRLSAHLKIWLFFHVPLTLALLVALCIHIVVVFYYW